MRLQRSRTTFIPLAAALWRALSAVLGRESGARGWKDRERGALAAARRAVGRSRKVRQRRVAYLPPYVSFLAGQHRSAYRSTAETHAARSGFHDDERVRKCLDDGQAGGPQQVSEDGIEER
jgi:hypothetical protein